MQEQETKDTLQRELAHWKQVVKELEQKIEDLSLNEKNLIVIADNWQQVAKRYQRDAELWEHTAIKKGRRCEELYEEIEELEKASGTLPRNH